jgi:hypothetical protein
MTTAVLRQKILSLVPRESEPKTITVLAWYSCNLLDPNDLTVFTKPLHSNDRGVIHIDICREQGDYLSLTLTPWSESASELYRPTAACRRSDCQLLWIEGAT